MSLFKHRSPVVVALSAISALSVIALAACSSGSSGSTSSASASGPATITFMEAMSSGAQQAALKSITADFKKDNPGINVQLEEQPDYATLNAKITAQTAAGKPPTIAQVYPDWAVKLADSGVIVPLDDKTASSPNYSNFFTGVQNDLKLPDGKTWLWPFNKSVVVVYRNSALVPKAATTWSEFADSAKKVSHGKVVALSIDPGSSSGPAGGTAMFEILAEAYGTPVFAKDGTPQFDQAGALAAMKYMQQMKKDGSLALGTNYPGQTALGSQTGAYDVSSVASYPYNLSAVGGKFTMAVDQMPAGPAKQANQLAGTDVALFAKATPAEQAAGFKYMEYLASPKVQAYWSEKTGYLPVNNKALDAPDFKAYAAKTPFILDATKQLNTASGLPAAPWVTQASGLLAVAIQDVLNKGADPQTALAAAQKQALTLQKNS